MFTTNIINYFFFFDKAGCTRCFFSKTHQSSLTLKFFLKSTRPSLPLKKGLSKTHQSSLTLKGGSTAFPKPLSPQGTGDVSTALSIVFTTPSVPLVGDRNGAQTATL